MANLSYLVSLNEKANYLLNNDTFYVIKNIPTNTYIEPIIMGQGYIVHDNWLEATWWTNQEDAQNRIAESVRDIYKVVKIGCIVGCTGEGSLQCDCDRRTE